MKIANGPGSITIAVLTAVVLLSAGSAEAGITLDSVSGLWGPDTIQCGVPVEFQFLWNGSEIGTGNFVLGSSNGFRVHDNGTGAIWAYLLGDSVGGEWNPAYDWGQWYDGGYFVNIFPDPLEGGPSDTIGFSGYRLFAPGIPDTVDEVFAIVRIQADCGSHGKDICIDSTWYAPSNPWLWSTESGPVEPSWDGPHCFTVHRPDPPEIACPGGPIDTTICALQPICIGLPITNADYVDAGGASWANDSLCFTPTSAGSYTYIVTAGNIIGESVCTVTVNVHRVLEATPDNMLFVATASDTVPPPDQIVDLSSPCPPGSIDWELTFFSEGNWVAVDKITGSNPDQVIVSANTVGMAEGIYDGFLAFRDGPGGPILATVNLSLFIGAGANIGDDVVEPGASVSVPINIYPGSGLCGFTIPLRYTVGALKMQLDGVILDSVVIDTLYADSSLILPDSGMIVVKRTVQDPPLPDSTIKVADIYFSIDSAVAGEMVTIDTATFELTMAPYTYIFKYCDSSTTVPEFNPGVIIIVDTLQPDITCPEGPVEMAVNAGGQYCLSLPIINVDSVEVNGGDPGYWWQDNTLCFEAESPGVYPIHVMGWNIWGTAFCDLVVEVLDTSLCSFEIATVTAGIGEVVDVPVYAHRIDNLGSISFSIAYPDSLLQVQSVSSDYLFGFQFVDAAGQIDLTWDDFASPISIPDSQPILTISMLEVYGGNATAPVLWVGQNEALDNLGQPLPWIKYCDGGVSIIGTDVDGSCVIEPDTLFVVWETALDTVFAVIYIGQFSDGYQAGDVDSLSLMVNGIFSPQSVEVIPSYPGWDGEALEATVVAAQMFLGLGLLWDTTTHAFSVTGDFVSGARFLAEGQMVVVSRIHGDVTSDGMIDIADLTYLVDYLFHHGPRPPYLETADADVDGAVNIGDVIYLVDLLF